jgi:hypothetical protein
MESLGENIYAAFGVFGFIIIGMGLVIKYLVDEKKSDKIAHEKFMDKIADAIVVMKTIIDERL